jgi:hypothetical protein
MQCELQLEEDTCNDGNIGKSLPGDKCKRFQTGNQKTISVTQVYPNRTVESAEMADTRHAAQLNLNLTSRLFLNCQLVIALIKKRQRMNRMHMLILTEIQSTTG